MEFLKRAKEHYLKKFVKEHEIVIGELTGLRDEIQKIAKKQKEFSHCASFNGVLSGGLVLGGLLLSPFTGGGSLCAAVGTVYGATYGSIDVISDVFSTSSISKKLSEAQKNLEEYKRSLETMYEYLEQLQKTITIVSRCIEDIDQRKFEMDKTFDQSLQLISQIWRVGATVKRLNMHTILSKGGEINQLLKLHEPLRGVMSNAARQAVKEAATGTVRNIANVGSKSIAKRSAEKLVEDTVVSTKIMGTVAVIGIILDVKAMLSKGQDLDRFKNGKFCDQARILNRAIEDLKGEFELISGFFKTASSFS